MNAHIDRLLTHIKAYPSPWRTWDSEGRSGEVYQPNREAIQAWRATAAELSALIPLEAYARRLNWPVATVQAWAQHGFEGRGIHPAFLLRS